MRFYVYICIFLIHTVLPSKVFAATEPTFIIGAVVFEGATVFNAQQLGGVYQPVVGRNYGTDSRSTLESRTRALYQENGFLEPEVTVTAHPTIASIVLVRVTEPGISRIEVTNADSGVTSRILRSLAALNNRRPISKALIDRALASLRYLEDFNLGYTLIPNPDHPSDLGLVLTLRPQINGALTYTSEGDRRLGRHMALGQISMSNPVRHVNKIAVSALHTLESDQYRVGTGNVEFAITPRNSLSLEAKTGRAILERDATTKTVYRFQQYQSQWSYDLNPGAPKQAEVYGSLISRDFTRTTEGTRELDEQLRMVDIGVHTLLPGADRAHRFALSGRFGVDAFGARRGGSEDGDGVDTSFQILRPEYTHWQGLPAGFLLRTDIEGQYSPDDLPSSQSFTIGGSSFSRAYEPGEFSGDSGIGGNVELRRKFAGNRWLPGQVTPFIYYALAILYENDTSNRESAAAAGVGLRVSGRGYSGFLEYGKPLTISSRYKDDEARMNGRFTVFF